MSGSLIKTIVLVAKLTMLSSGLIFGFLYIDATGSEVYPNEISTRLDGTEQTKVGQYLVFNGKSHPLSDRIYYNGYDLFYQLKKGDTLRVVLDTNNFVASLNVNGEQVFTLDDYTASKIVRTERWLSLSKWFFAGFIFFYFLGLRGKNK